TRDRLVTLLELTPYQKNVLNEARELSRESDRSLRELFVVGSARPLKDQGLEKRRQALLKSISADTAAVLAQEARLEEAQRQLEKRKEVLAGLPEAKAVPSPEQFRLTRLSRDYLTEARVNEFCAHPRLDLFVDANSPHPAEKFGCTSCH